jgi:hypothetical protein
VTQTLGEGGAVDHQALTRLQQQVIGARRSMAGTGETPVLAEFPADLLRDLAGSTRQPRSGFGREPNAETDEDEARDHVQPAPHRRPVHPRSDLAGERQEDNPVERGEHQEDAAQ